MSSSSFRTAGMVLLVLAASVLVGMVGSGDFGSTSWMALIAGGGAGTACILRARALARVDNSADS